MYPCIYTAAIFLLDANYEVYVWLGWWPEEKNKLLKEANATTGSAHARWLRDKKLALQTAQNYIKGILYTCMIQLNCIQKAHP